MPKTLPLSKEECRLLLAHVDTLPHVQRLALRLLLSTGLRVGELATSRISYLLPSYLAPKYLRVPAYNAKNGIERNIPLRQPDIDLITQSTNHHGEGLLPGSQCNCPLLDPINLYEPSIRTIQRWVDAAGKAALGRPLHPHVLRHTFASHILHHTDIRTVQYLLGHQDLKSTMIYTHVDHDRIKGAVEALEW